MDVCKMSGGGCVNMIGPLFTQSASTYARFLEFVCCINLIMSLSTSAITPLLASAFITWIATWLYVFNTHFLVSSLVYFFFNDSLAVSPATPVRSITCGTRHIATPSWIALLSLASLNAENMLMTNTEFIGSSCCYFTFTAVCLPISKHILPPCP